MYLKRNLVHPYNENFRKITKNTLFYNLKLKNVSLIKVIKKYPILLFSNKNILITHFKLKFYYYSKISFE